MRQTATVKTRIQSSKHVARISDTHQNITAPAVDITNTVVLTASRKEDVRMPMVQKKAELNILDTLNHKLHYLTNPRSEEHTSELQSLMRISYAVFCLNKKHHEQNQNKRTYSLDQHSSQPQ